MSEFADDMEEYGPAFPLVVTPGDQGHFGMRLRDYLACHASDKDVSLTMTDYYEQNYTREDYQPITRQQARYMFADAMLEARSK